MELQKCKFDGSVDQAATNLFQRRSRAAIRFLRFPSTVYEEIGHTSAVFRGCLGEESILVRLSRCVDTKAFPRLPALYLAQPEPNGAPGFFARRFVAHRGLVADISNN
jgi:hypothetical protein